MRKSVGISKYELKWQIVRVSVKGGKIPLQEKLKKTRKYFEETYSYDRWERVYNWLEGLERGYKNKDNNKVLQIQGEKLFYDEIKGICSNGDFLFKNDYSQIDDSDLLLLYKDIFKTNLNWLKSGYFHRGCNDFLENLYIVIFNRNIILKEKYTFSIIQEYRKNIYFIKNKHRFFF